MRFLSIITGCFFLIISTLTARPDQVTAADFTTLNGIYSGTLTYTNYQDGQLVHMPITASFITKANEVDFDIHPYEGNKVYNHSFDMKIKQGEIEDFTLVKNEIAEGGPLVVETDGKDDNREAVIRYTLAPTEKGIRLTKQVRFIKDGPSASFFVRNQYNMIRVEVPEAPRYEAVNGETTGIANVTIPAGQEFILGEYADHKFKATLTNKSGIGVDVRVLDKTTDQQNSGFGLGGNGEATIHVSATEKVVLVNESAKEVTIRVKLNRGVEGMRYQDIE